MIKIARYLGRTLTVLEIIKPRKLYDYAASMRTPTISQFGFGLKDCKEFVERHIQKGE